MKITITQSTTIAGKEIAAGEVVDVDKATSVLLKSQNQAVDFVEPVKETDEKKKKTRHPELVSGSKKNTKQIYSHQKKDGSQ